MKRITLKKFGATRLTVIATVERTGESFIITKRGKPFVALVPASAPADGIFGFMAGKSRIKGDIVKGGLLKFRE